MNYQQTIDYLYKHLPMFSRVGAAAYKKDLQNTISLCTELKNPQTKFKSIHIAGTNGKGSTSHMLAAILQQAGYKTGLYTSPHLKTFRERIKVNGEMITEEFVIDFTENTKAISQAIKPSFFELTVAMAFDYFAKEKVDVAIIETGLGGRLDSTNIITPVLSVITNIGYDHMNILGNSLEEIAMEKAGIIKPNVPVVIGEYLPQTKSIFINKAQNCNAPVYLVQDEYKVLQVNLTAHNLCCTIQQINSNRIENFTLDLNGIYQTNNLCTVLCAIDILKKAGFDINDENEKYALSNTKKITGLRGRWDVIAENPAVILDVAHNEDGIKQVMLQVSLIRKNTSSVHIILGMVKDKEINKVLALLPQDAFYYYTNAHIPRALPATNLKTMGMVYNLSGKCFDNVNEAITAAKLSAKADDIILVCGSVFLVGEVNY